LAARIFCEEIEGEDLAYGLRRRRLRLYKDYDVEEGERDFRHFYVDMTRSNPFTMIYRMTCAYDGVDNEQYDAAGQ